MSALLDPSKFGKITVDADIRSVSWIKILVGSVLGAIAAGGISLASQTLSVHEDAKLNLDPPCPALVKNCYNVAQKLDKYFAYYRYCKESHRPKYKAALRKVAQHCEHIAIILTQLVLREVPREMAHFHEAKEHYRQVCYLSLTCMEKLC